MRKESFFFDTVKGKNHVFAYHLTTQFATWVGQRGELGSYLESEPLFHNHLSAIVNIQTFDCRLGNTTSVDGEPVLDYISAAKVRLFHDNQSKNAQKSVID